MRDTVDGFNRSYRILVADADPEIREIVELTLKAYGYDMVCVADGFAAWSAAQAEPVDLAIVDLHLPGADGYDFIGRCRADATLAMVPVIVLSAADDEACSRAFELGATFYLAKPVLWPILANTVWYILRNEAREAEMRALRARLAERHQTAA